MAFTEPDETTDEGNGEETITSVRAAQRRAEKRAKDLDAELLEANAAKRELAFLKAGVDTDTPLGKVFVKAYDGELTADAIKGEWEALGATPTKPEVEVPAIPDEERASTRERQSLAGGSQGDTGETPEVPVRGQDGRAARVARDAMANGAGRDTALGVMFNQIAQAAARGDQSVLVQPGPQ